MLNKNTVHMYTHLSLYMCTPLYFVFCTHVLFVNSLINDSICITFSFFTFSQHNLTTNDDHIHLPIVPPTSYTSC